MTVDGICDLYRCLADPTRLRMLNLLREGSLCVCHLQSLLGEAQVKVSKHLAYLKSHGVVSSERRSNWMIYSITDEAAPLLDGHLSDLRKFGSKTSTLAADLKRLDKADLSALCC